MSTQSDPLRTTAQELQSKSTIIIAGDSWGRGEWEQREVYDVVHFGLEQYLKDEGYNVINCSRGGNNNYQSFLSLQNTLKIYKDCNQDSKQKLKIFFFWTDWHRDFCPPGCLSDIFYPELIELYHDNLCHQVFHRIFKLLENLADSFSCQIGLIGGCSDVINVGNAYPGLFTVCQSFTNLCLHDDEAIEDPVYANFSSNFNYDSPKLKTKCFLDDLDKFSNRKLQWHDNPQWFWPDGIHANRFAHKKLYDFLKAKNYI